MSSNLLRTIPLACLTSVSLMSSGCTPSSGGSQSSGRPQSSGVSQEKWAPPPIPGEKIVAAATVKADLATELQIGSERIVLEETLLDSVKRRLNAGPIGEIGEAASHLTWLCLSGGSGQQQWMLWLESGEMGGGSVEGFHLLSVSPGTQVDHRCARAVPDVKVTVSEGLALDAADSTLRRALGEPSAAAGDTVIFLYVREPPRKDAVESRVSVVLNRRRVVQIAAWRSSAF